MLQIQYKSINTEFHRPFTTAHGQKTHQPALLIAVTFNGITGFGEAPAIHYYNVSVESMIDELLSKIDMLQRYSFTEPERFWHFCHHLFPKNSFLVCALDMAYWDMFAKMKRKKIFELFPADLSEGMTRSDAPMTDFTIGIDKLDNMLRLIAENPMPIYKIKVGDEHDIETLKNIRNHTDAVIRIDANAAWSLQEALERIPVLEQLNIELIEQPLAKDNFEETKFLASKTSIPVIADESCVSEHDVPRCAGMFDGINIKLTKCGGITPAIRMIQQARKLKLKIMMGNMCETETGIYAIAQFLPLLDYADLDGPLLLKVPPLKLLKFEHAVVSFL